MKRYVQSKWSKEAPAFETTTEGAHCWTVIEDGIFYVLPKSEYHEVSAPERWERCSSGLVSIATCDRRALFIDSANIYVPHGYRWAWDKQEDGTLVIERKVNE